MMTIMEDFRCNNQPIKLFPLLQNQLDSQLMNSQLHLYQVQKQISILLKDTILSEQWQYRKAGIMAFSALAETPNDETVKCLIFSAINTIIKNLEDQNNRVKMATASALSRVAENYPECLILHAQAKEFLDCLLKNLNSRFKLAQHIVWVLVYLTENVSKYTQSPFYADKFNILQNLASMAVRKDIGNTEYSLIDTSFMGILNIMYLVTNPVECKNFLQEFLQQLKNSQTYDKERRNHIQTGLLTTMHGCLVRLNPNDISDQEANDIYTTVRNIDQNDISSDCLYTLSGLASSIRKRFSKYCGEMIGLLNSTLQRPEDFETFKTSLFCLADIARALEDEFLPYLPIINYLIGLINNPAFNRELKIHVYSSIADIILATRENSLVYLPDVKLIMYQGFQGCALLSDSGDPAQLDYADRLKEILVSSYTCLLHAYCDDSNQNGNHLTDTLQWLFQFCEKMCDKRLKPTLEFARCSLNAIMDIANFYTNSQQQKQIIYGFITGPFVIDLIQTLNKYKQGQEYNEDITYAQLMLKQHGYKLELN